MDPRNPHSPAPLTPSTTRRCSFLTSFTSGTNYSTRAARRRTSATTASVSCLVRVPINPLCLCHPTRNISTTPPPRLPTSPHTNTPGLTGVGYKLVDELLTLPRGLSPQLEAAMESFTEQNKVRRFYVLSSVGFEVGVRRRGFGFVHSALPRLLKYSLRCVSFCSCTFPYSFYCFFCMFIAKYNLNIILK